MRLVRAAVLSANLLAGCMLFKPIEPADDAGRGGAFNGGSNGIAPPRGGAAGASGDSSRGGSLASGGKLAAGGGPMAGEGGALPEGGGPNTVCESNKDCNTDPSEPSMCRTSDGRCVRLDTNGCRVLVGDPAKLSDTLRNPRALYFGAFAEFADSDAAKTVEHTYELALREFQQADGLPFGQGDRRPLVMVLCGNEGSAVDIDARMQHLIVDIGVPAIVAALPSADLLRNFDSDYGRDTFFLTPQKVSGALALADTDGQVWSLLGRSSDLAAIYAATLRQFELYHRANSARELRVALVTDLADADPYELYTAVSSKLRFNDGKSLNDNLDLGNALVIDQSTGQELFDRIHDFAPDIVLSFVRTRYTQPAGIAMGIDQVLPERPYHLLCPYNFADKDGLEQVFKIERAASIAHPETRFFGIDAPSALDPGSLQAKRDYETNLRSLYPDALLGFENYYDAVYYVTYAMFAGDPPMSGRGTARGMQRLYVGKEVAYVGPGNQDGENIKATFSDLGTFPAIFLMGTLGPPNFDMKGSRVTTGSIYCYDGTVQFSSVYGYDAEKDQLTPSASPLPCLWDFLSATATSATQK